jgi:hypothetical protein
MTIRLRIVEIDHSIKNRNEEQHRAEKQDKWVLCEPAEHWTPRDCKDRNSIKEMSCHSLKIN